MSWITQDRYDFFIKWNKIKVLWVFLYDYKFIVKIPLIIMNKFMNVLLCKRLDILKILFVLFDIVEFGFMFEFDLELFLWNIEIMIGVSKLIWRKIRGHIRHHIIFIIRFRVFLLHFNKKAELKI